MKKTIEYKVMDKTVRRQYNYIPIRYIIAVMLTVFEIAAIIGIVMLLCDYGINRKRLPDMPSEAYPESPEIREGYDKERTLDALFALACQNFRTIALTHKFFHFFNL